MLQLSLQEAARTCVGSRRLVILTDIHVIPVLGMGDIGKIALMIIVKRITMIIAIVLGASCPSITTEHLIK